jgi:hypothetical protein
VALATNHRSEKGLIVSLTVIADSLVARAEGVLFQCDRGGETISCGILALALRDLIDFHRIKSSEKDAFRVLLPEIERLVNAKYDAGRLESDGLFIRSVDLLRYGFQRRRKAA